LGSVALADKVNPVFSQSMLMITTSTLSPEAYEPWDPQPCSSPFPKPAAIPECAQIANATEFLNAGNYTADGHSFCRELFNAAFFSCSIFPTVAGVTK